jgi:hypothetical protein
MVGTIQRRFILPVAALAAFLTLPAPEAVLATFPAVRGVAQVATLRIQLTITGGFHYHGALLGQQKGTQTYCSSTTSRATATTLYTIVYNLKGADDALTGAPSHDAVSLSVRHYNPQVSRYSGFGNVDLLVSVRHHAYYAGTLRSPWRVTIQVAPGGRAGTFTGSHLTPLSTSSGRAPVEVSGSWQCSKLFTYTGA